MVPTLLLLLTLGTAVSPLSAFARPADSSDTGSNTGSKTAKASASSKARHATPKSKAQAQARAREAREAREQARQQQIDDASAATARVTARAMAPTAPATRAAQGTVARERMEAVASSGLPISVTNAMARAGIPLSSLSALVVRLDDGQQKLAFNADRPMTPASTMKLVTSYAGLAMLGPDFRWQTSAFADGTLTNGVLHGNLYIEGTGDPKLVPEQLIDLVDQIRRAGITQIDGDLVLDKGYFDISTRNAPPLDDAVNAPYNVGPDPLAYAFKALTIDVTPDPGGSVQVAIQPPLAQLRVANTMNSSRGACRSAAAATPSISTGQDGTLNVRFSGVLPLRCGAQQTNIAVLDHTQFFAGGFLALWQQAGGTFNGTVREGAIPVIAQRVGVHYSPPLAEDIRDMNKFSNNLMARNLYLTIGAITFKPPATLEDTQRMVSRWLRRNHIESDGLVIGNGSGLSRDASISARTMGALLSSAYASPVMQPFADSLPTVGVDGTMRRRLSNKDIAGHAQIKTGTLNNVRAIAGYVFAANGHPYAVVSFINDARSSAGQAAHDALLDWVYDLPS